MFLHQFDDQIELIGNFQPGMVGWNAGLDKRVKAVLDQHCHAAAQYRLFAKNITDRFMFKSGSDLTLWRDPDTPGQLTRGPPRHTTRILSNRDESRYRSIGEIFVPQSNARSMGCNQYDIAGFGRLYQTEVNRQAVQKNQCTPG